MRRRPGVALVALWPLSACTITHSLIERSEDANQSGGSTSAPVVRPISDHAIAAFWHTCLTQAPNAYCWGRNDAGVVSGSAETVVTVPYALEDAPELVAVVAGNELSCGLDATRGVWCWGSNERGQLGQGDLLPRSTPVPVMLPATVHQLSSGTAHVCAVLERGELWCWGENAEQQLAQSGPAYPDPVSRPARVGTERDFVWVGAGDGHTCALRRPGSLWCWGRNVAVGAPGAERAEPQLAVPTRVGDREDFIQVTSGQYSSCALSTTGRAYCWGSNEFGQLGSSEAEPAPGARQALPISVNTDQVFVDVSTSVFASCGLTINQQLYCWGFNEFGEFGLGHQRPQYTPVRVLPGTRVSEFALGWQHLCVRSASGVLSCSGRSKEGQVGSGTLGTVSAFETPRLP